MKNLRLKAYLVRQDGPRQGQEGRGRMLFRGIISYPMCQSCGKRMRIIRRGLRSDDDGYFERQVFICARCDLRIERGVNTDGTVREPRQGGHPTDKVDHA